MKINHRLRIEWVRKFSENSKRKRLIQFIGNVWCELSRVTSSIELIVSGNIISVTSFENETKTINSQCYRTFLITKHVSDAQQTEICCFITHIIQSEQSVEIEKKNSYNTTKLQQAMSVNTFFNVFLITMCVCLSFVSFFSFDFVV